MLPLTNSLKLTDISTESLKVYGNVEGTAYAFAGTGTSQKDSPSKSILPRPKCYKLIVDLINDQKKVVSCICSEQLRVQRCSGPVPPFHTKLSIAVQSLKLTWMELRECLT